MQFLNGLIFLKQYVFEVLWVYADLLSVQKI